jgi:hypothetical protein
VREQRPSTDGGPVIAVAIDDEKKVLFGSSLI